MSIPCNPRSNNSFKPTPTARLNSGVGHHKVSLVARPAIAYELTFHERSRNRRFAVRVRGSYQGVLRLLNRWLLFREDVALPVGIFNPPTGNLEIAFFTFDAYELQTHPGAGNASCPAAHEWVQYNVIFK